ncbi:2-hydroxyacid dehydrogenase [Balneola vulgaris]|uniref:2-hydroxyacid dehydrogenase n=1 Tax=Balneola vulgaris TaxID=287535 RepID=UPI0003A841EC|nr:glyoxylate/hydroxypyruvate reductase A [Balneola vulgaris]
MSLLLIAPNRDLSPLKEELLALDPNLDLDIWPAVNNKERVTFAVTWNHPKNTLKQYPNLTAVSSLGAGINHLLSDPDLSDKTTLARLITPSLKKQMGEYVLTAVLSYRTHIPKYVDQKREAHWGAKSLIPKEDCTIGIMGLGEMGETTARTLVANGYKVLGWSRTAKNIDGVSSFTHDELDSFLSQTNILVCLLPLTPETESILDLELFKKLKSPSYLINVGRGQHLVEEDLIYGIDTGALEGAWLDVFEQEPLPKNHLFWNRPSIMITPHIASVTDPKEAAEMILENYKRSLSGQELINEVDRTKGY